MSGGISCANDDEVHRRSIHPHVGILHPLSPLSKTHHRDIVVMVKKKKKKKKKNCFIIQRRLKNRLCVVLSISPVVSSSLAADKREIVPPCIHCLRG